MEDINEKLHIPDPDNIDIVVDNILDEMMKEILTEIYKHLPSSGNLVNSKIMDGFYIDREINPCCKWLGTDCAFVYNVDFRNKVSGSMLCDAGDNICYIEKGENGKPNVIHNCVIEQTFNINLSELKAYKSKYLPTDYLKLRSNIRHELEHAYKETVHPEKFRYEEQPKDYETDFIRAYDRICNRIFELQFIQQRRRMTEDEKDEFLLLELMYQCCYIERDAFVSGFYQKLIDDAKAGRLKPINNYYEYDKFKTGIEKIRKFNNPGVLSEYKDSIKAMYGESASNNFDILRKHIVSESDKITNKLQKLYTVVSMYGKVKMTQDELAASESLYYDDLYKMFYGDNLNENSEYDMELIGNIIGKYYSESPYNSIAWKVKMFFGKMIKSLNHAR